MLDLKALRAAAEKATPGPWHAPGLGEVHTPDHLELISGARYPSDDPDDQMTTLSDDDARYLAMLDPSTVLALLDLAEREQYRQTRQGTHWADCWRVHDDCAAALWREHKQEQEELLMGFGADFNAEEETACE